MLLSLFSLFNSMDVHYTHFLEFSQNCLGHFSLSYTPVTKRQSRLNPIFSYFMPAPMQLKVSGEKHITMLTGPTLNLWPQTSSGLSTLSVIHIVFPWSIHSPLALLIFHTDPPSADFKYLLVYPHSSLMTLIPNYNRSNQNGASANNHPYIHHLPVFAPS